ncbi:hypothetical protein KPY62_00825 [Psychrobacter sp. TAE2020]|uniref:hypothetical protein n=1 Tax=Psychrobacter sp. TAE2020 TaxID=2846762 RepID=UPI001C1118A5|nr:hypothetical protein [Psychrobacter sp. TAE2020]MBU5615666.1 hypothetical protein [Psychrobacter sp. TAE2020]
MVETKKTIYLDQNVLTELRINKLYANDLKFVQLLKLLISKEYTIVYSRVTLSEIYNIGNKDYIEEHLKTLKLLNAIYLNSIFTLDEHDVTNIYENFVKSYENKFSKKIHFSAKNFIKKLNGINVGITTKDSFNNMLSEAIDMPFSYLNERLPIMIRANKYISKKAAGFTIKYFSSISDELLDFDPVKFRQYIKIDTEVKAIEAEQAMFVAIKALCDYDPHFINIFQFNENNIETKIEFFFNFLNWIGYYPDKFQNDTNKKGFHAASMRDAAHAGTAWHFDYVISDDYNFRQKTRACYAYVGSKTKVLSIDEFLSLH